jgi:hypothetical protein
MDNGKVIGNVNVLDIRKATDESIASIKRIGNVNIVIYTPETAHLISQMNIGNMNISLEIKSESEVKTTIGKVLINKSFIKEMMSDVYLLVIGQVVVEADVTPDDLQKSLDGLSVIGQIICPDSVLGVIQSKSAQVIGNTTTYPPFADIRMESVTLDSDFLKGLADGTELAIVGNLKATKVLPNELVEQKINKLFISGNVTLPEENLTAIQPRLMSGYKKLEVIPSGTQWVDKPLQLDSYLLENLPARKLFCTEYIEVTADVSPALFDQSLDKIKSKSILLAPANLKEVVTPKIDVMEDRVIFYQGELVLVDDSRKIKPVHLSAKSGKVTWVVMGDLVIDEDVTPKLLEEKLEKVHNLGVIKCSEEQMPVIESKLGLKNGVLTTSDELEDQEEVVDGHYISNANFLTL